MKNDKNKCETCGAFDPHKYATGKVNGICRANTPAVDGHNKWPPVSGGYDWCLKHTDNRKCNASKN